MKATVRFIGGSTGMIKNNPARGRFRRVGQGADKSPVLTHWGNIVRPPAFVNPQKVKKRNQAHQFLSR
jgi:hypothetical protein